jgi:hypothetical protein
MSRRALLTLLAVPFAVACGPSASETQAPDGPSTMSGSVALTQYTLDNPVVIARNVQGIAYVAPVMKDGRFKLTLPSTDHYRVILASTRRDGTYRAVSEIRWGASQSAWGSFVKAGTTDIGTVRPVGAAQGVRTASKGSGSGGTDDSAQTSSAPEDSSSSSSSDDSSSEPESCYKPGKADLPYDARPNVGDSWKLLDAFLEKGAPPTAVLDVTMEGGGAWRLAELKSGAEFVITQADCDHEGNKATGRDRIFVTWENSDGSTETDHLDMRYCSGGGGGGTATVAAAPTGECKGSEGSACSDDSTGKSDCDGSSLKPEDHPADALPTCSAEGTATGGADGTEPSAGGAGDAVDGAGGTSDSSPSPSIAGGVAGAGAAPGAGGVSDAGAACVTSANCAGNLSCFGSICASTVR